MSISILILTLNEESNIADCIQSVKWSDDIVVLDSFSTDTTEDIAMQNGARVIKRKFDNWSNHQNWAVENIRFSHQWVFYLDADERCSRELAEEMKREIEGNPACDAYRIKRKDFYRGKWLKRAQLYPTWFIRLYKPGKIRYERLVNPVAHVAGSTGSLSNDIIHFPFSHGVAHWIARHNHYSDMEALEVIRTNRNEAPRLRDLISKDPNVRRMYLKDFFYRLPARPVIKFLYYYGIRRGFMDGIPGLHYAMLQAIYEYLIVLKTDEIRRKQKGLAN